jgi:AcrR family transcriptional regulator
MPKIVDHAAYKIELVDRAIPVFRQFGYAAVGMREMARELGISKSALYHYFPSKKELFTSCCTRIVSPSSDTAVSVPIGKVGIAGLMLLITEAEKVFKDDVLLLLDYARSLTPDEFQQDKNLKLALEPYAQAFAWELGEQRGAEALYFVVGALLARALNGSKPELTEIEAQLRRLQPEKGDVC